MEATPAGVWERSTYKERKLVSMSVPIVHCDTTPHLESLLGGVLEGAVAAKVIRALTFGTLLGLRDLAMNKSVIRSDLLPLDILTLSVFGPSLILAALLLGLWEDLVKRYLFPFSPRDVVPHLLLDALECISLLEGAHPLHLLDFLETEFELQVSHFLLGK